jgi:hypothetical protein
LRARTGAHLVGSYPPLPRPLDALSERWTSLRPRVRAVVALAAVAALALGLSARIARAEARWGGPPVTVLVARQDLLVGATELALRAVQLPPAAAPPGALAEVGEGAVLALALPEGSVLTSAHVDARGPAAGLSQGLRAVPLPVEDGWRVVAGGRVDVWVLGAGSDAALLVAEGRSVLEVAEDAGTGAATALVGLAANEVGPVSEGLALGQVLLTHAPP